MASRLAAACLLSAAVLTGCGELSSPDLAHGSVAGRIVGASPGAYAYPLGRPDLKVALAADGRFELAAQSVGPVSVVLFDGSTPGRAELVAVEVPGAGRVQIELNGELAPVEASLKMPLAGTLVASVLPAGGAVAVSPRVAIDGTDRFGVGDASGVVTLGPLPAGAFTLRALVDGYQPAVLPVQVAAGQPGVTSFTSVDVPLLVGNAAGPLGCAAGGQCRNGLLCNPADGLCHQCLSDGDCGSDACNLATGLCKSPGGMLTTVCSSCTSNLQCGTTGTCVTAAGASSGYCTRFFPSGPPPADPCPATFVCPTGLACQPDGKRGLCVPQGTCGQLFSEFGEPCFDSETCSGSRGIAGGRCHGASGEGGTPGFCTGPCATDTDCIVPGFVCDPTALVCVPG